MRIKPSSYRLQVRIRLLSACMLLIYLYAGQAIAAPTGSDLLNACEVSMKSGFDSISGQMCSWYSFPCDCDLNDGLPRVCLPDDLSKNRAAEIIVDGLKAEIELQKQPAAEAAIRILARNYPCQEVK